MMTQKIAAAIFWLAGSLAAAAQTPLAQIPAGTITIVVPLAAGGPADALARIVAERVGQNINRSIIIENRAGAGGNIGAAFVAKAKPDGLTWLFSPDSIVTVNPHVYKSQGFDAAQDLIPIAEVGQFSLILAINPKAAPVNSFSELVEYSKKNDLSFGSAGPGSPGHLALEYLRLVSDIRAAHVPYRGAALVLQDLVAGNIQAGFIVAGALLPHIKAGTLRGLAVSANERSRFLPEVPSAQEAGIKGFDARFYNYFFAPSGVKPEVRAAFSAALRDAVNDPSVRARIEEQATDPTTADETTSVAQVARERKKWGEIIVKAGIKVE